MADAQFSFETDVLPVVQMWARKRFARDNESETKTLDALSVAWEVWRTAPSGVSPGNIAHFAVKSVAANRHVRGVRSIDGKQSKHNSKPEREYFDVAQISRVGDDPAEIAAFRCDFTQWLESLNETQKAMVEMLGRGDKTSEVAATIGCSPGNVSQYRKRLEAN